MSEWAVLIMLFGMMCLSIVLFVAGIGIGISICKEQQKDNLYMQYVWLN